MYTTIVLMLLTQQPIQEHSPIDYFDNNNTISREELFGNTSPSKSKVLKEQNVNSPAIIPPNSKPKTVKTIAQKPKEESCDCDTCKQIATQTVKTDMGTHLDVKYKKFDAKQARQISAMKKIFKQIKQAAEESDVESVNIPVQESNIEFVKSELKEAGYTVIIGNPNELHISWGE